MKCRMLLLLIAAFLMTTFNAQAAPAPKAAQPAVTGVNVPILLYHRFGPAVVDGMTIKTSVFEQQLKYLKANGYHFIPLRSLVNYYLKKGPAPAPKSVVIVEDDAHKSVYSDMLPLAKKYNIPVTVFVYPSAISNAKYAMTWEQLKTLKANGFDIECHTYWHPNFKKDKRKMTQAEYEKSVTMQLKKSKEKLESKLGGPIDMLAWPFGIYDDYLLKRAAQLGYKATFTIEGRHATARENVMKLPRYLLINSDQGKNFARIVEGSAPKRNIAF